MLNKIINIFKSRILWIGFILLLELTLFGFFIYEVVTSFINIFDFSVTTTILVLGGLALLLNFVAIVYIVNSKAKPAYKITWLVVISLLPYIGIFIYLLFGNKKITNRQRRRIEPLLNAVSSTRIDQKIEKKLDEENPNAIKMAEYITSASGADLYKNSEVTYYTSGEEAYPEMLRQLKRAKKFIFIEYFVVSLGEMWNSILEILKEKANAGVDVRVLYDDFGSAKKLPWNYDKYLNSIGIKTFAFHKFKPLLDVKLNNRDHRKIMVVDGKVAFSGGINLADEYINKISPFGYWKDNAIKIKGEAVHGLTALFISQWLMVSKVDLSKVNFRSNDYIKFFPDNTDIKANGYVQPYGDIPFNNESVGERVYLNLISRASKYIYITTPYLIIDDELTNALTNAAKQGIDVRIITPHIPDKKVIFGITRSHYYHLLNNGVKIYEYTPGFIHMKTFVVDDLYATVGTINLDYRSLYLHYENGTFMYKTDCIAVMKNDFLDSISKSQEITLKIYKDYVAPKRLLWAILKLFAPLF